MSEIVNDAKFTVLEATKQVHVDGSEKITLKTSASGNGSITLDSTGGGISISGSTVNVWGALNVTDSLVITGNLTVKGTVAGDSINFNNVDMDNVDIDSGTIDGTTIGATSASSGAFTTLTSSGATSITGALTITGLLGTTGNVPSDNGAPDQTTPQTDNVARFIPVTIGGTVYHVPAYT